MKNIKDGTAQRVKTKEEKTKKTQSQKNFFIENNDLKKT
jgi:hypothetical protein